MATGVEESERFIVGEHQSVRVGVGHAVYG